MAVREKRRLIPTGFVLYKTTYLLSFTTNIPSVTSRDSRWYTEVSAIKHRKGCQGFESYCISVRSHTERSLRNFPDFPYKRFSQRTFSSQSQPKLYPSDPILFQQYSDLIIGPVINTLTWISHSIPCTIMLNTPFVSFINYEHPVSPTPYPHTPCRGGTSMRKSPGCRSDNLN